MFCKLAFGTDDLAATAKTATATNGINVDAKAARSIQYRRAVPECATPARGREYDFCVFVVQSFLSSWDRESGLAPTTLH